MSPKRDHEAMFSALCNELLKIIVRISSLMLSTVDNYTLSMNKISPNFNCIDLAFSVNKFQKDRGSALSYWKPAKKGSDACSVYEK